MKKIIQKIIQKRSLSQIIDSFVNRYCTWLPDKMYISIRFRCQMGYWMSWKNPQSFSEKLQWLKLYNRNTEYTTMVDKYAVKEFVAKRIGTEYIIPTLGTWENVDDIDWNTLPEQFVLKTTHGGGNTGVVICKNKTNFNKKEAIAKLRKSMHADIYKSLREWPYKNVHKRIIAEKFMASSEQEDLVDYKFTCFNGKVHNVMVCTDRAYGETKFYFFDQNWNLLPLNIRGLNTDPNFKLPKPKHIDKMFEIASILSQGIPFLRVDLYNIDDVIYFGETTFFPASGFDKNLLPQTEELFGNNIILPTSKK